MVTCLVGASTIGLLLSFHTMTPILQVMSGSLACLIAANGANTTLLKDMLEDGQKIGTVTGVSLTCSNSLGLFAPIVTGYIVAWTGRFDMAWYMCSGALLVAGLLSVLLVGSPIRMQHEEDNPASGF